MKKNVASQHIAAQVLSATDGSAVTASVTVTVSGDGGAQAAGGGTLTHLGGGHWDYVPTQAETNYSHVVFQFEATGALSVVVQVYPSFPQTGDAYAEATNGTYGLSAIETLVDDLESRIGTPSNLGGGATIAQNLADIEAQTDDIGAAGAGLTALGDARLANLDATVSSRLASASYTAPPSAATIAAAVWDYLSASATTVGSLGKRIVDYLTGDSYARLGAPAGASVSADVAAVKSQTAAIETDTQDIQSRLPAALVSGRMDSSIGAVANGAITNAGFAAGAVDAAALAGGAVDEIWDDAIDGSYTARQLLRLIASTLLAKLSGAATTTVTIRDLADSKDRVTATVDADGNRTAVTLDAT